MICSAWLILSALMGVAAGIAVFPGMGTPAIPQQS